MNVDNLINQFQMMAIPSGNTQHEKKYHTEGRDVQSQQKAARQQQFVRQRGLSDRKCDLLSLDRDALESFEADVFNVDGESLSDGVKKIKRALDDKRKQLKDKLKEGRLSKNRAAWGKGSDVKTLEEEISRLYERKKRLVDKENKEVAEKAYIKVAVSPIYLGQLAEFVKPFLIEFMTDKMVILLKKWLAGDCSPLSDSNKILLRGIDDIGDLRKLMKQNPDLVRKGIVNAAGLTFDIGNESGYKWCGIDFTGAKFLSCKLQGCVFEDAVFNKSLFYDCYFDRCEFKNVGFDCSDMGGITLNRCSFDSVSMDQAVITEGTSFRLRRKEENIGNARPLICAVLLAAEKALQEGNSLLAEKLIKKLAPLCSRSHDFDSLYKIFQRFHIVFKNNPDFLQDFISLFELANDEAAKIVIQQFVERYRESPLSELPDMLRENIFCCLIVCTEIAISVDSIFAFVEAELRFNPSASPESYWRAILEKLKDMKEEEKIKELLSHALSEKCSDMIIKLAQEYAPEKLSMEQQLKVLSL